MTHRLLFDCSCDQEGLCTSTTSAQEVPFPGPGGPSDSYSCSGHLTIILLKCILRRAALENHPEATTSSESRGPDRVGNGVFYPVTPLLCELH